MQPDLPQTPARSPGAAVLVVIAAALVMAATLPGRTHGLGLITERLTADFPALSERDFSNINCWATLLGGLFCLPCGWLLDRVRPRYLVFGTMLALGATLLAMANVRSTWSLLALITFTRGFGQSMLSVISITLMAKWFRRDAALPMGGYAVCMTMLMAVGMGVLGSRITTLGWRGSWQELGWAIILLAPIACLAAWPVTAGRKQDEVALSPLSSAGLNTALGTSCFWVFALSISLFGLVSAGVSLYHQRIFATQGLSEQVYRTSQIIGLFTGLVANFGVGWLARHHSLARLLAISLAIFAGSLLTMPLLSTPAQAYAQAAVHGLAGGGITVLFFVVWGQAFGPRHVGAIQGATQWMTVVASAVGPLVISGGRDWLGGYQGIFWLSSGVTAALAVAAFVTPVPSASRGDWSQLQLSSQQHLELSQETA